MSREVRAAEDFENIKARFFRNRIVRAAEETAWNVDMASRAVCDIAWNILKGAWNVLEGIFIFAVCAADLIDILIVLAIALLNTKRKGGRSGNDRS